MYQILSESVEFYRRRDENILVCLNFAVHSVVSAADAKQCHKMALNPLIAAPVGTDASQARMSVIPADSR